MPLPIAHVDHDNGVVALSDGTRWQVGPGDAATIAAWRAGRPAALTAPGPARLLVYQDDGSAALVCPAAPPGRP